MESFSFPIYDLICIRRIDTDEGVIEKIGVPRVVPDDYEVNVAKWIDEMSVYIANG